MPNKARQESQTIKAEETAIPSKGICAHPFRKSKGRRSIMEIDVHNIPPLLRNKHLFLSTEEDIFHREGRHDQVIEDPP